jgi:hypothetical protein
MKKRHYVVVPREAKIMEDGLDIDGKHIDFNGKSQLEIADTGIVNAIENKYGLSAVGMDSGRVWTERNEMADNHFNYHDGGHRYFFGPTKALSEAWDRIFGSRGD